MRPLARRGRRAAAAVGRFLASTGQVPDLALTSPAVRATQTLELAMAAGGWTCAAREVPSFYGADAGSVLAEVRAAPDDAGVLLLVGHEPGWSEATALLIGGGRVRMPTAAVALVTVDVTRWRAVAPGAGELTWMVVPRLLPGAGG